MKKITIRNIIISISLFSGLVTSCGDYTTSKKPALESDIQLTGLAARKLANPKVAICWDELDDSTPQHRNWVRQAVTNNWEKHSSSVRFTGWDDECGFFSSAIPIVVKEVDNPEVQPTADNKVKEIRFNFTFLQTFKCTRGLEFCIKAIAVHEFGHVLGFTHENHRPERPASCTAPLRGTAGDTNITAYDPKSIMNYCNAPWLGDGNLSPLDIQGLQKWYGR